MKAARAESEIRRVGQAILPATGFQPLLKKSGNRLLTRAVLNRVSVFARA